MTNPDQTEREIYAGRVVTLRLKYLRQPDGRAHLREIVEHASGAAVVAVDAAGQVLLVRQLRPAVDAHLLELPAGLVDPGEQLQPARTPAGVGVRLRGDRAHPGAGVRHHRADGQEARRDADGQITGGGIEADDRVGHAASRVAWVMV